MRSLLMVFFAVFLFTLSPLVAAQDGQGLFRQCASCHVTEANGPARIGPNLSGLEDRQAASVEDYRYSDALLQRSQQGLVWTAQTLDEFLEAPATYVPGNQMGFAGIKDAAKRATLVEWLLDVTSTAPDGAAVNIDEDVARVLSQEADADYGEYLAGECVTCHKAEGATAGVPSIVGLGPEPFVRAILDYKNGVRVNQVMGLMAGNLGEGEIAALALYFSTL